jgi:hypothetical protein
MNRMFSKIKKLTVCIRVDISTAFTNILFLSIKVLVFLILPLKINFIPLTKVNMVSVTILSTISGSISNFCSHSEGKLDVM